MEGLTGLAAVVMFLAIPTVIGGVLHILSGSQIAD